MDLRILLADNHRLVRDGLRALIEHESGLCVVGEADDGQQAVALAHQLQPDVVVLEAVLPLLSGVEAIRQISATRPGTRMVALSQHADRHLVVATLRAGARAYVLKKNAFHELVCAIHAAAGGQVFVSPQIAGIVAGDFTARPGAQALAESGELTGREREVLQLLVEGWTAERISEALNISPNTVSTHRCHIMAKLDIHTLPELTKFALRAGITFLDA